MDKCLLKYFWNCGDDQIIQFALVRAHLNRYEKDVITLALDECMTQEEIAEAMDLSTRQIQKIWKSGSIKMIAIPWVRAFALELSSKEDSH